MVPQLSKHWAKFPLTPPAVREGSEGPSQSPKDWGSPAMLHGGLWMPGLPPLSHQSQH